MSKIDKLNSNISKTEMKKVLGGLSDEELIAYTTQNLVNSSAVSVKVGDKLASLKCNGVCGLIKPPK